jgi:hypothetical protein
VIFPGKKEPVPGGYTLLERTPFKYEADLNAGAGTTSIFLAYRQRLCNVEQLQGDGLRHNSSDALRLNGAGASRRWDSKEARGESAATEATAMGAAVGTSVPDLEDTRSEAMASSSALEDLWAQADMRWGGAASGKGGELGPVLRRTLLRPLVAALYVGNADVTAVALRELLKLASRHLGASMDESCRVLQVRLVGSLEVRVLGGLAFLL